MIYTVTFSPAVDYIVDLKTLEKGAINRSQGEHCLAGGKGINGGFGAFCSVDAGVEVCRAGTEFVNAGA